MLICKFAVNVKENNLTVRRANAGEENLWICLAAQENETRN